MRYPLQSGDRVAAQLVIGAARSRHSFSVFRSRQGLVAENRFLANVPDLLEIAPARVETRTSAVWSQAFVTWTTAVAVAFAVPADAAIEMCVVPTRPIL